MKRLTILGATGSVGLRALELVSSFPEEFRVVGLAARGSNIDLLADLCRKYGPKAVALLDEGAVDRLAAVLPAPRPELLRGPAGLIELAGQVDADIVISALVGAAGLLPTMAAIRAGRTLALANKETLVMAGSLMTAAARRHKPSARSYCVWSAKVPAAVRKPPASVGSRATAESRARRTSSGLSLLASSATAKAS